MALAKHHEEIGERMIANISEMTEARLGEIIQPTPLRVPLAGEVFLNRSGRKMEDIEVCEAGQTLELTVNSIAGTAQPEIEIEDRDGRRQLKFDAKGKLKLRFKKAHSSQLIVSSAGYMKIYTLHIVEPFDATQLPDFAKLIQALTDNPPQWTDQSFKAFRIKLKQVLDAGAVPELFTQGIIEYHLGLFHEDRRLPSFRERFQSSFGCLRWFILYSDIARLICTYYLYCANEFEAAENLSRGRRGRLKEANSFFLDSPSRRTSRTGKTAKTRPGLSLLVSLPDALTFQAVEALNEGKYQNALELCTAAKKQNQPAFDRERAVRLDYLQAITKARMGDSTGARTIFESLRYSPWPLIATAASRYLAN